MKLHLLRQIGTYMMDIVKRSVLFSFVISYFAAAQEPVANLPQGRIVGIKVYVGNSITPVEIFYGIPYATPPVGRYRFSAPERHAGWRRTFFAHRIPPRCPQVSDNDRDYMSEDCLYLNIWAPARHSDESSVPVVVILHSESWERGGPVPVLPFQELASEGIVVVTVAYRLHLLSFFTLRSVSARGNLALLDQYLALLWVRDNIAAFGGDPTQITLLGHSAGADSVLYHMASPRTIGLFERAIVMSPKDVWRSIDKNLDLNVTEPERLSRQVARTLGCTSNIDQEILTCMRARSLADIMALYPNMSWTGPSPDNFLPKTEQYLPMPLSEAFAAGMPSFKLDLLMGTTELEVINSEDNFLELSKHDASYITEFADTRVIPEILRLFSLHNVETYPLLQQAIHWEFWGATSRNNSRSRAASMESLDALARMKSSAKWGAGSALLSARLAGRVSRLFLYQYTQSGVDLYGVKHNFSGAVHGTDLVALLGNDFILQLARRQASLEEKRMSAVFQNYIANFIKYGSPTLEEEWNRYKLGDGYVHVIRDIVSSGSGLRLRSASKDAAFWLQYLPQITSLLTTPERTEQLSSENGESRLRGGVFAMCGVLVALLLLLLACAILLRRERMYRSAATDLHL